MPPTKLFVNRCLTEIRAFSCRSVGNLISAHMTNCSVSQLTSCQRSLFSGNFEKSVNPSNLGGVIRGK